MQKFRNFTSLVKSGKYAAGGHVKEHASTRTDLLNDEDIDKYRNLINTQPKEIERTFATYSWLPKIKLYAFSPSRLYHPSIAKFIATTFESNKAEAVSDVYYPPKIHENGIHIYSSVKYGSTIRYGRSVDFLYGGFILGVAQYPFFVIPAGLLAYFLGFNAYFYELSRRMVIRMDLLPHTQQVAVQKVGAFGTLYTKLIKIEDLEHVDFKTLEVKENYFWDINYNVADPRMIFRDKSTGDLLLFDRRGLWDKEGLEHELLN